MIQKKITFAAKDTDVLEWNGDLLAVGVTEKDVVKDDNNNFTNPLLQKLDALLGGLLAEASSEEDFCGKSGQAIVLRVSGLSFKRVGLFALGQSASRAAAFVGLGEAIAAAAQASRAVSVAFALAFSADLSDEWKPAIASSIAIGIVNGIFNGRARRDRKRFEDRVKEEDNGGNVDEKHAKVIEYKSKGDVGDGKVQFGGTTDEKRSLGNVKENEKALVERGQCDVPNLVHNKQLIFGMTPPIPSLSFGKEDEYFVEEDGWTQILSQLQISSKEQPCSSLFFILYHSGFLQHSRL